MLVNKEDRRESSACKSRTKKITQATVPLQLIKIIRAVVGESNNNLHLLLSFIYVYRNG